MRLRHTRCLDIINEDRPSGEEMTYKHKPEWGRSNLMVLAAFRYCLGRRTYIVSDCVEWLLEWWDDIDETTQEFIVKEIQDAIAREAAGDECDVRCWHTIVRCYTMARERSEKNEDKKENK
jgi:hypothetical protein